MGFAVTFESTLTTAHLADACLRVGVTPRSVPLRAVRAETRLFGRAIPVRHFGSVDIFLEAIDSASPGDVLVVDNDGRTDEACIGDLVTIEADKAGLGGIVIWGCHRDTAEIRAIGLPLFSLSATPLEPMRLDPRDDLAFEFANIADFTVTAGDYVLADDDGVLFLPSDRLDDLIREAESIRDVERLQAERVRGGVTLREQLQFSTYLKRRESDSGLTFRKHLQTLGGAIEEGFD
jgi:regulator of RNase E activity RraA